MSTPIYDDMLAAARELQDPSRQAVSRYGSAFWEGEASGGAVLTTTYGQPNREKILPTFASIASQAYSTNTVVFSVILARLMLFSEATLKFRRLTDKGLFGNQDLAKIEHPWPNGTTGELLARMEQDVSLAGNAFVRDVGDHLERLRPDGVTIVSELVDGPFGQYRKVLGYCYDPEPFEPERRPDVYPVDEVAHWSPIPDPLAAFRGMSWVTPVIREVQADQGLTAYKALYMENAATPNMVIKYDQKLSEGAVSAVGERFKARHGGVNNAFRTIVLDQGADATVVGNTMEQMNFTTVQAAGENRIAAAGGVPGIVVGLKEGLMAATYSNYEQAMRRFADLTMRPLWRSACAALAPLVTVPAGAQLWYDISDIAALRQGEKERAETSLVKAQTAGELIKAGFDPDSVITALDAADFSLLTHGGLVPRTLIEDPATAGAEPGVQAFPLGPQATAPVAPPAVNGTKPPPALNGTRRS